MPKSSTLPPMFQGKEGRHSDELPCSSAGTMPREQVIRNLMNYSRALWSAKSTKGHVHLLMN